MRTQDITIAVRTSGDYYIYSGSTVLADNLASLVVAEKVRDDVVAANNGCTNRNFNAVSA